MNSKAQKRTQDDLAQGADARALKISETRWQDRPLLTLQLASELASVSVASIYRYGEVGPLRLRRLAGRTLVETESFIEWVKSAEPWKPSARGKAARDMRKRRDSKYRRNR